MADKSNKLKDQWNFNPESPLEGQDISKDLRHAVTPILHALYKSNKAFLPIRIDQKCRERLLHEIECLHNHNTGRVLKFSDCKMDDTSGKSGWAKSNEGGREWRKGTIKGTVLDCLVQLDTGKIISERLIKDGFVTIVQSRRIREEDRRENKNSYYHDTKKITCQSCGVEVNITSEITICPYCGAYIESSFYDWQLESFEIGKQKPKILRNYGILLPIVILPLVLFVLLAENWYEGLAPGLCTGIVLGLIYITLDLLLTKDWSKIIVRYSENTLRKNLTEYLWNEIPDKNLLERNLDEFVIKKIINSETETRIVVNAHIQEQKYNPIGKIESKCISKKITLIRARFPDRMKAKGIILQEKECPSCGANYIPDKNGNCSYCGYGLYVQNRDWIVEEVGH